MSDLLDGFVKISDSFVEIQCCGKSVGFANGRPFTDEAAARFTAIQRRVGNAWIDDAEAKALIADPASYGSPADGTPIAFPCETCGAQFAWAGGVPRRVAAG